MVTNTAYYVKIGGTEYDGTMSARTVMSLQNKVGSFDLVYADRANAIYDAVETGDEVKIYRTSDDTLMFGGFIWDLPRMKQRGQKLTISGTDYTGICRRILVDAQIYEGKEESTVIRDIFHNYVMTTDIIDNCNATTGWAAGGDFSSLALDTDNERVGTGCLTATATYSSGTGTFTKTISAGITFVNTDTIVVYIHRSASDVLGTNIRLNFGQDASNYYTITRAVSGITFSSDGWQYVIFDVSTKTTGAGAPSLSNCDYFQVSMDVATSASSDTVKVDELRRVPNTEADITLDNVQTGTNYTGYVQFFNENVFDICTTKLGKQYGHDFYIDKNKIVNYGVFGVTSSGVTFERGVNIYSMTLSSGMGKKITEITVHGGRQSYVQPAELFNGDGSTDTFTLSVEPIAVEVTVGGTVKTGYTPGGTGTFDYTLKAASKQVVFQAGSIPGAGVNNVSIVPYIGVPVIAAGDTGETSLFKKSMIKTENTYLDNIDDALAIVSSQLDQFGDDIEMSTINSRIQDSIEPGETVDVIDENLFTGTRTYTVQQITTNWIGRKMGSSLQVGEKPVDSTDTMLAIKAKITALENKDKTPSDVVQKLLRLTDDLGFLDDPASNAVAETSYINDKFCIGHATNDILYSDVSGSETYRKVSSFDTASDWAEDSGSVTLTEGADSTSGHFTEGTQGLNYSWVAGSGNGIIVSTPASSNWANILKTYCLNFDGTGDYVAIPEIASYDFERTDNFTINLWFNSDASAAANRRLVSKAAVTTTIQGYHVLYNASTNNLTWQIGNGTTTNTSPNITSTNSAWNMFTGVLDQTAGRIRSYHNGSQQGTGNTITLTGSMLNNDPLHIATRSNSPGDGVVDFDGRVANVAIWNRALSDAEIAALYTSPNSPPTSGLVGWWKLNDNSTTTATDSSSNANNGTITNATVSSTWFYPWRGTMDLWGYVPQGADISALSLRVGSSASDYVSKTAQQYAWKVAGFESSFSVPDAKLVYFLFDMDGSTWATKAIDWTAVDYLQLNWTIASAGNITFDKMSLSFRDDIGVARIGDHDTVKSANAISGVSS